MKCRAKNHISKKDNEFYRLKLRIPLFNDFLKIKFKLMITKIKNSLDIFCTVLDNYGDAGVCLRLARDLSLKQFNVFLYCDDLKTLNTIKDKKDEENENLHIKKWNDKLEDYDPSEYVIQAFSCRLCQNAIDKIKVKHSKVINLEYLSAEKWVEDCHKCQSFGDGFTSYFFFPGFTKGTGGVVTEENFIKKLQKNNLKSSEIRKVTLFSYENSHIKDIISLLSKSKKKSEITVFEGKALNNLNQQLKLNLQPGQYFDLNQKISIKAVKMVSQDEYDDYLLSADLNLVRGEDSIVRAMLSGKPFLWQIYVQEDNAHILKLMSFFDRLEEVVKPSETFFILKNLMLSYNDAHEFPLIDSYDEFEQNVNEIFKLWSLHLLNLGSLSDNLCDFLLSLNA